MGSGPTVFFRARRLGRGGGAERDKRNDQEAGWCRGEAERENSTQHKLETAAVRGKRILRIVPSTQTPSRFVLQSHQQTAAGGQLLIEQRHYHDDPTYYHRKYPQA